MYFVILTGTSAQIAIASETEKKERRLYLIPTINGLVQERITLPCFKTNYIPLNTWTKKQNIFSRGSFANFISWIGFWPTSLGMDGLRIAFAPARKPSGWSFCSHKNGDFGADCAFHFWLTKRSTRTLRRRAKISREFHKWRACSQAKRTTPRWSRP